ncbi:uncharacterized protein F4807DRAFT_464600 [Annulohypoxylon truncatum]|uniref:uncharacterized protein n=1 Tax=Annulohypoxylon truncatum TaxID=327061 RepID=UPI0020087BFE|nr:uncharacterized protein F4807DRAFT_464600 [Annulohypoxylon truncatum]KAI1205513.1 hypothetical protein F4807DRAFT_464600 [Annulohypoxylon truncatum]
MENPDIKTVSHDGKDILLEFQGRRSHIPQPLSINDTTVVEELGFPYKPSMKLSQPGFDWGLGCFGNLSKIIGTSKNEYDDLYWFDFFEINTAKQLFDGSQVWDDDDAWIRFVRSTQRVEEPKTEEQLIKFNATQPESSDEVEPVQVRPRTSDADRFLAMLDNMESALEVGNEARNISTSVEYPRWVLRNFRDWIEEADFIEANISAPSGSRYYTTSDTR